MGSYPSDLSPVCVVGWLFDSLLRHLDVITELIWLFCPERNQLLDTMLREVSLILQLSSVHNLGASLRSFLSSALDSDSLLLRLVGATNLHILYI